MIVGNSSRSLSTVIVWVVLVVVTLIDDSKSEYVQEELVWSNNLCQELGYGSDFEYCGELYFCQGDGLHRQRRQRQRQRNLRGMMEHVYYDYPAHDKEEVMSIMEVEEEVDMKEGMNDGANKAAFGWKLRPEDECTWPGPLIRMTRGHKYGLLVHGSGDEDVVTNLHTHGLHVAGHGNGDDVTRKVSGDDVIIYNLDIPSHHMGGTFWYHSHYHGHTCEQVSGGAFGMLIIDDSGDDNNVGTDDAAVKAFLSKDNEIRLIATNLSGPWVANGAAGTKIDTYTIRPEAWYRFRILTVNMDDHQSQQTLSFDSHACDVYAVAHDGIFRFQVPASTAKHEYVLSVSARLDVAIQCRTKSEIKINNHVIAILDMDTASGTASGVSPSPWVGGVTGASWSSQRPPYLQDLRSKTVDESFTLKVDETNLNGFQYSPIDPLCNNGNTDFKFGTVQEWTIHTATHPFHVHMYPMQIVSCDSDDNALEVGEYYDTVWKYKGDCVVRMNFVDIGGRTAFHCHIFKHGDQGAMAFVNVNGGPVQPNEPRVYKCSDPPCDEPVIPNKCSGN